MKTSWKPRPKKWPEEKSAAIFCNRWRCCPRDWNREHPEDPITRVQWRAEQGHINRLFFWGRVHERDCSLPDDHEPPCRDARDDYLR